LRETQQERRIVLEDALEAALVDLRRLLELPPLAQLVETSTSAAARRRSRSGSSMRPTPERARRAVLPPNTSGRISTTTYASAPASGRNAMARIQIMLRPVLITCAIRPTCTARDRISINDTMDSGKARGGPAAIVEPPARV
jgi:hypothetical protein